MSDIIKTEEIAVFFSRLSILFPLNILNALAQIVRNYPRIIAKQSYKFVFRLINIVVLLFSFLSLVFLNSKWNLHSYTVYKDGPIDFVPGPFYYYLALLSIFILVSIIYFWKKNLAYYTKTQKIQIYYLFGALLLVYISMSLGLLILPGYGLSSYAPFMFLSLSFLLFMINKSLLVRVAVVDIQEEFVKLLGIITAAIIMLCFWNATIFVDTDINFVGKFLISFVFLVFLKYIYQLVTSIYERREQIAENEIRNFVDRSRAFLRVEDVLNQVKKTLSKILIVDSINYISVNDHNGSDFISNFQMWWGSRSKTPFVNKEILIESYYDRENNKEVTKEIYSYFQLNNIDMLIPVSSNKGLKGLIYVLGIQKIINEYLYKDLTLLSDSISVSMSRASVYEELEQFNQTLQQKVNEQTQELQVKVQQLQEARRKERDMIDIMGHELRTPATVVKLNAELLEKFTDDVINNKEKFELYVKRIKTAVDNEIKLINTLLSSAKLEGDKIELNLEEVDVLVDIDMAIHGHMQLAEDKGLNLVNNSDQSTPTIFADHARVIEILNNLVDNAIKYTEKGNVIISTSYTDDMITISVEDTGKGISKDEIPNLGQKFYRIGNYLDNGEGKPDLVRPGGTGLGLYVAFSLIEKMGGKMDIRSEPGKGSKFSFTLPKYKGQDTNFSKRDSKDMFERLGLKHTNL